MPAAIRDVELSSPFTTLSSIGAYSRCMLVFRWRRRIVGRAFVDVREGRVEASDIERAAGAVGPAGGRAWMEDTLGFDDRAVVEAPKLSATIAICTRERPDDLERALHGVTTQTPAADEVVVVDNAPLSERTRAVV